MYQDFNFIDLFAGCGGLSVGMLNAGFSGIFAIEKSPDAFRTFKYNLIEENPVRPAIHPIFSNWPNWLEVGETDITEIVMIARKDLGRLKRHIDVLAGGPPCQGFSFAGRRKEQDPRNQLFKVYLDFVHIIEPKVAVIENVKGIDSPFNNGNGQRKYSYAQELRISLEEFGYSVQQALVFSAQFGVPQYRPRFITIAFNRKAFPKIRFDFFQRLENSRFEFLESKNLPQRQMTVMDAIGDIANSPKRQICRDEDSPRGRFMEIVYQEPHNPRAYTKYIRKECPKGYQPNSLRLVNHQKDTIMKYSMILKGCRKGVQLSDNEKNMLEENGCVKSKKRTIVALSSEKPAHTITTIPDDLIHYKDPRVHTVREYARFQSFPDWFAFKGKFTTGGGRRRHECPRYTQVGNAVPPLLSEAIGRTIMNILMGV